MLFLLFYYNKNIKMNKYVYASNGKYVVSKNSIVGWVYDIDISLNNKVIAVVGFLEKQTEGAIFWQIKYDRFIWSMANEIKKVAKDYFFITHLDI